MPKDISEIEFDHDRLDQAVKHRHIETGVTFEQDGVLFSSGFEPIRFLKETERHSEMRDEIDEMSAAEMRAALRRVKHGQSISPPKKKKKKKKDATKADVRTRADDKLAGFKPDDQPDFVKQALSENHAAVMAEESVE